MAADLPFVTAKEAVGMLGDDGVAHLLQAHQEGIVHLQGRKVERAGLPPGIEWEVIPLQYFAGNDALLNVDSNTVETDGTTTDFAKFEHGWQRGLWVDVRLARHEINALAKSIAGATGSSSGAERACLRWLIEEMKASEKPPRAKATYRADAKGLFKVGPNSFDRAWSQAIFDTGRELWKKAGRNKRAPS